MSKIISPKSLNDSYEVGVAETEQDLQEIYRLRKQIYVDEFNYINCTSEWLKDTIDSYSLNYYVKYKNKIIGTARFTDERKGSLELSYDLNWKKHLRKDMMYCEITRRVFLPEHRNNFATFILIKFIFEKCLENKVNAAVIGAEKIWKNYYKKLGFNMLKDVNFIVNGFKHSPIYSLYYMYFDNDHSIETLLKTIKSKINIAKGSLENQVI